jgi:DNA polymerase-1
MGRSRQRRCWRGGSRTQRILAPQAREALATGGEASDITTTDTSTEAATNGASPAAAGKQRLVILDSHGIIFRSYFALRDVLTVRRTGEPVAAVFGYANSLLTVLNELEPTHVIAAWDASSSTFRKERDERYKATRRETPEDLVPQFDRVRQLLDAFRIPLVELEGYEADDILGTLADQAAEVGVEVIIVTLDNDIVQLIQPGVRVYMYRPYQRDYVMYDDDAVHERWGFEPERMVDYKALVGDNSDNIPGVKGIGEKGAKALIDRYGTLEEMIAHLEEIEPKRTRTALEQGLDEAQLSKELATIVRDVPGIALDLDSAVVHEYDRDAVLELFRELEFRSLINRLPASSEPSKQRTDEAGVEGEYEVVTTSKALKALVKAVKQSGRFAFQLVADDPHPIRAADCLVGFAISPEAGKASYVPFGHMAPGESAAQQKLLEDDDDEAAPDQLARGEVFKALAPLFTDPKIERIAHDGKQGLLALAEANEGFWTASIDFDTQIAAYDLGDSNMTLQRLAFDRLGVEAPEERDLLGSGRKKVAYSQAGTEEVGAYAAQQADLIRRVEAPLAAELQANELDTVFREIDLPHIVPLARMEQFGVAVDLDVLTQLAATLGHDIEEAEAECYGAVGHEFKIGSPQELSTVLFEELELPKTRKTKTGFTTDANALEPLRSAHPVVDAILRWRELTKIKSTYVDSLPKQVNPRTGRVHSVFSQVTAATGRLSSNDPNLQNIPVRTEVGTEVRRAFIARDCGDDPVLLAVDYSQIELRVLAHISGDEELRRAFHEHRDIHASTAARVFHLPEDEVDAEMRRRAKVFNFGVLYGLTAFGLSTREGIPRDEATAFIDAYFEAYPKVQEWRERTVDEARAQGYAETLSGRRRYIPDLRASNRNQRQAAERIAINMPVQGTASDIIKIAMNRLDGELLARREAGKQARMILQVHDELIFELPREELEETRELARELMPSMELAVPLELDEKVGVSWGDME